MVLKTDYLPKDPGLSGAVNAAGVKVNELDALTATGRLSETELNAAIVSGAPTAATDFADEDDRANLTGWKTQTGHPITILKGDSGSGDFTISGGVLSHAVRPAGQATALYLGTVLGDRARDIRFGVMWVNDGYAADESFVIVVSGQRFTVGYPYTDAAVHDVIGRASTIIQTFDTFPAGPTNLSGYTYPTPLAYGVVHYFRLVIEGDEATLYFPDGTTRTVTDARILENGGAHVTLEVYGVASPGVQRNRVVVTSFEASSILKPEKRASTPRLTQAFVRKTGTAANVPLTSTYQLLASLPNVMVPASKRLVVMGQVYVAHPNAGDVFIRVDLGGNEASATTLKLFSGVTAGQLFPFFLVLEMDEFSVGNADYPARLLVRSTASGATAYSEPSGRMSPAIITVEPDRLTLA